MSEDSRSPGTDACVLSLCPTHADAITMGRLLDAVGLDSAVFEDAAEFCAALTGEVGVLLMSEEALFGPAGARVHRLLAAQEDWSAIPLIVLTGGTLAATGADALRGFEGYGRVTLLERPVRLAVLATVVRMAVAARLQQYRVRDLLAERAEAIARRDDFLAMLGHELRNPLGAVSTCAEVLVQGLSAPQGEECARIIQAQARDMKRLLDDLLDVSRLTRGRLALRREPVELGQILRDVVTQVGHELEGRSQALDLRLPEDALPVHADPTRLRQVFANLLNNASRYSPPGSAVTLSAERGEAGVLVRVRDQGQGMTRETLERVFEPFWQASGRERHGGFGIGLTLAHRLVEMHGGRIDARSDGPGLGSELLVDLPLSEQPRAVAPAPARPADADGRRVLVIDDNRDLAFGIRLLLGRQGYQVELAGDGAAGIAAAERKRPDVILLDIGLPDMDGFEVARRLRRLPGLDGVRLVGMSGFGGDDHHRRSQAAGIDRYLTKPVTAEALAEAVAAGPEGG